MRIKNFLKKSLHRKIGIIISPVLILTPLLIILVFFSKYASSSSATYITQWGSLGTANGDFDTPSGIAIDASDDVYVTDTNNNRIEKFDSSGVFILAFGASGTGNGQFTTPLGIAVDPSGNVYVADSGNNRIEKFDSSGNYLTQWGSSGTGNGQFDTPEGVAVDYLGNVYVLDTNNNRVQKFDNSGTYVLQWGSLGTADLEFDTPGGIAVDPWGNVFVADTNNNRIQEFDSSGNFLTNWGSAGSGNGQFSNMQAISIDASGNVYAVDTGNNRIQLFKNDGTFILKWGTIGSGNSQFDAPWAIDIDSSSNVFIADRNNNRIQEFSTSFDLGTYSDTANPSTYQGSNDVNALVEVGTTLYLGGTFGIEAVDMNSGDQIVWDFGLGSTPSAVLSLVFFNNTLYAGTNNGLLSFDTSTTTGTLNPWVPNFGGGSVKALAVVDSTLYAGGSFTTIDGSPRFNLAAFDISTPEGVLTSFTADTDTGSGQYIAVLKGVGTDLYAGGFFNTIGGTSQPTLAKIDTNTGTIDSNFIPSFDAGEFPHINSLEALGSNIYAGGFFTTVNSNSSFTNLVSLADTNGDPDTTWTPSPAFNVSALAIQNGYLYAGEDGTSDGEALAYKLSTGDLVDWVPASDQPITSMVTTADALYVGLKQPSGLGMKKQNKNFSPFANLSFHMPVAYADIGGLIGTIFLARFNAFAAPTATPTLIPTSTPTPTPVSATATPTPTGTLTPTPTPTGTLTPTPTGTLTPTPVSGSSSSTTTTSITSTSAQLTQAAVNATIAKNLSIQNNGNLPPSGPKDIINLGLLGFIFVIIGAGLLLL